MFFIFSSFSLSSRLVERCYSYIISTFVIDMCTYFVSLYAIPKFFFCTTRTNVLGGEGCGGGEREMGDLPRWVQGMPHKRV